jgi:hypothetical protein
MTAPELLGYARSAGLTVLADGDRLVLRGPQECEELARQLLGRKAEILGLLRQPKPNGANPTCPAPGLTAWDQAEAERLLARLRNELVRIERDYYRGKMPQVAANLAADGLSIADGYVANHDAEAARGWDAMELLRGLVEDLPGVVRGDRLET